jgi:hypothetical protein
MRVRCLGSFQRSLRVTDKVDVNKIEAHFKKGVPETLPKTPEAQKVMKIEVKGGCVLTALREGGEAASLAAPFYGWMPAPTGRNPRSPDGGSGPCSTSRGRLEAPGLPMPPQTRRRRSRALRQPQSRRRAPNGTSRVGRPTLCRGKRCG